MLFNFKMINTDFHSHILPGIDHGSDGLKTSLFQIRSAIAAGIENIVATSHFYPHRHHTRSFLESRAKAYHDLTEALDDEQKINIIPAAEILLCEKLDRLPELSELAVGNTNNLLIELPMNGFSKKHVDALEEMISHGYSIILAHPERFPRENIESVLPLGVKLQLNATALSGLFIKPHIKDWIARDLVTALGSDIHMADKNAYKRFLRAAKKLEVMDRTINEKIDLILK